MITIDARGKACPIPVIMVKKMLRDQSAGNNEDIQILVDNAIAVQNLEKMAHQLAIPTTATQTAYGAYAVVYQRTGEGGIPPVPAGISPDPVTINDISATEIALDEYVTVLSADTMGNGDAVLGKKLMESFIYALTEQDVLPRMVLLYNTGVRLVSENEKTIADLTLLQEKGTEILSCGVCLNFYGLTESVQVGSITNMYRIVEVMRMYKTLTP